MKSLLILERPSPTIGGYFNVQLGTLDLRYLAQRPEIIVSGYLPSHLLTVRQHLLSKKSAHNHPSSVCYF